MVTVVATQGSTPREAGARLIVNPDGTFTGTIGGGTLEWRAIALAQAALARPGARKAETRKFILGPDMGQCCGGQVELALEVFGPGRARPPPPISPGAKFGGLVQHPCPSLADKGIERTVLEALAVPPGTAALRDGVLIEGFGDDRRPLLLFGAGHVGRALVMALAPLPFAVTLDRPAARRVPAIPAGERAGPPRLGPRCRARRGSGGCLRPGDDPQPPARSRRRPCRARRRALSLCRPDRLASKRVRFERRLAEAGVSPERIADLVCPIGVTGIESKVPAAIAAATVAELLIRDEALRSAALPAAREDFPPACIAG